MERFLVGAALTVAAVMVLGSMFGSTNLRFQINDDEAPAAARGAPVAAGSEVRYAATEADVRNAAAVVTVTPEDRTDIAIVIAGGAKLPPLKARIEGSRLILDGGLGRKVRHCETDGAAASSYSATVSGYGALSEADVAHVTIKMPRSVKLAVSDGVLAQVGPSDQADVAFAGCAGGAIGDVKGKLTLSSAGSGDIVASAAQSAKVSVAGSGEVSLGDIAQGFEASIAGSGSTHAKSVTGPIAISIAGSGDVDVKGGAVSKADISIAGSGDVTIGAPVVDLSASIMGSGDVDVASVSGAVRRSVMGSGGVTIGETHAPPAPPAAPQPPQPPAAPKQP